MPVAVGIFALGLLASLSWPVAAEADGPPDKPTELTGSADHTSVSLRWYAPAGNDTTSYQILRRDPTVNGVGVFVVLADDTGSPSPTYVDRDVVATQRYLYRVKGRNAEGLGLASTFFQVTLPAAPAGTTLVHAQSKNPARAPSSLTAEADVCGVNLTWKVPAEDTGSITGYRLRRTAEAGDSTILDSGYTYRSYRDSTVELGTSYTYTVMAMRADATSGNSNEVKTVVPGKSTPVDVEEVPIVVTSTTADYFVLYAKHQLDSSTTVEYPVSVTLGEAGTTTLALNVGPLPKERYRVEKFQVAQASDIDGDCRDDITELNNLGMMTPLHKGGPILPTDGAVAMVDHTTFESLANTFHGREDGKFVILEENTDRPLVYFQNTNKWRLHWNFVEQLLNVRHISSKVVRGRIGYHPEIVASSGVQGVFTFHNDYMTFPFSTIERAYTLLAASMPVLEDNLVFWIPNRHLPDYQPHLDSFRASRIPIVFDEDIYGDTDFLALNPAVGYGRLKALDPDETPHSRDIVLYGALPNELPRVAGVISTVPQTPLSHINLRAVQNGIPNAFIRDADDNSEITDLVDSYVRYEVTNDGLNELRHHPSVMTGKTRPAGRHKIECHKSRGSAPRLWKVTYA